MALEMRIYRRIVMYSLLAMVVPLLVVSIVFFLRMRSAVADEFAHAYRNIVQQQVDSVRSQTASRLALLDQIAASSLLRDVLTYPDVLDSDLFALSGRLDQFIASASAAQRQADVYLITIYSGKRKASLVSDHIVTYDEADELAWLDGQGYHNGRVLVVPTTSKGLRRQCISLLEPVVSYDPRSFAQVLGVVRIDLLMPDFLDSTLLGAAELRDASAYLFTQSGSLVYAQPRLPVKKDVREFVTAYLREERQSASARVTGAGLLFSSPCPELGFVYLLSVPFDGLRAKILDAALLIIICGMVFVAAFLFVMVMLGRPFQRRLAALVSKINKLKEGDLTSLQAIPGDDEIAVVDKHFNAMVERLRELIAENYEQVLENKSAQLQALQAQINPHFLYNTLELVNSIATVHDCAEINTICENLGGILRYNLASDSSPLTSLEAEVQNVRNYLAIQQVRFDGGLAVSFDVCADALNTTIPRFILQPIVENAILHGFTNGSGRWVLRISAACQQERLRIVVADNGAGMSEATLKELEDSMERDEPPGGSIRQRPQRIGMKNTYSRLKLAYGAAAKLVLKSELGGGTEVCVELPLVPGRLEVASHV